MIGQSSQSSMDVFLVERMLNELKVMNDLSVSAGILVFPNLKEFANFLGILCSSGV